MHIACVKVLTGPDNPQPVHTHSLHTDTTYTILCSITSNATPFYCVNVRTWLESTTTTTTTKTTKKNIAKREQRSKTKQNKSKAERNIYPATLTVYEILLDLSSGDRRQPYIHTLCSSYYVKTTVYLYERMPFGYNINTLGCNWKPTKEKKQALLYSTPWMSCRRHNGTKKKKKKKETRW